MPTRNPVCWGQTGFVATCGIIIAAEPTQTVHCAAGNGSPIVRLEQSCAWSHAMKTPIIFALSAILAVAAFQATAADRACRPSLSNAYHCPDTSASPKVTKQVERACRPSLSNLWHCPEPSGSRRSVVKPVERRAPSACCQVCRIGKACGNSCIARDKACHQPSGCACNG